MDESPHTTKLSLTTVADARESPQLLTHSGSARSAVPHAPAGEGCTLTPFRAEILALLLDSDPFGGDGNGSRDAEDLAGRAEPWSRPRGSGLC